jgi:hypothetical protein
VVVGGFHEAKIFGQQKVILQFAGRTPEPCRRIVLVPHPLPDRNPRPGWPRWMHRHDGFGMSDHMPRHEGNAR